MAPRIRIPAHVFGYSLAIAPAVAYAMYWKRNHKSDLELEEILNENYSTKIQGNRDKKEQMVKFFAAMKDPSTDPQQEKKMQEVLYGGKGDMKRHYAVDEKLYGTQEGVEQRRKMAEKEKEEKEEEKEQIMKKQKMVAGKSRDSSRGGGSSSNNKKKQKSKKKKQDSIVDEQHEKDCQFDHAPIIQKDSTVTTTAAAAAAVGTVGILALATVLLTGSKRT